MVVMDPLALPLSCPCVKGYAQRDYQRLADRIQARLKRPVKLVFNESLTVALRDQTDGKADLGDGALLGVGVVNERDAVVASAGDEAQVVAGIERDDPGLPACTKRKTGELVFRSVQDEHACGKGGGGDAIGDKRTVAQYAGAA